MNPLELPLALFALFGIVAVTPVWLWFVAEYGAQLPAEARYIAQMAFPMLLLLFVAGWVQPGGG